MLKKYNYDGTSPKNILLLWYTHIKHGKYLVKLIEKRYISKNTELLWGIPIKHVKNANQFFLNSWIIASTVKLLTLCVSKLLFYFPFLCVSN